MPDEFRGEWWCCSKSSPTKHAEQWSWPPTQPGHRDYLGTEHLLLALTDNRSSAGAQIFDEAGPASLDRLREHVLRQVAEDRANPLGRARPTSPP
ncbi:Clp protease N-terminal domain-containing protein [Rhodococcus opacus]|uniref:Clp protease N-terminal domain-containing protein n=1 Tax=Rhodococcus opacus TaxID=37919 RepID=UPI001ED976F1|nr:Clp protease N-terminal domain-containing protein [Rhodococcus opacus]